MSDVLLQQILSEMKSIKTDALRLGQMLAHSSLMSILSIQKC